MKKIPMNTQNRRQEVIIAADKLFTRNGYENTKIEDIEKEAKIAPGTFENYFKSKDKVLQGVIRRYIESVKELKSTIEYMKVLLNTFSPAVGQVC